MQVGENDNTSDTTITSDPEVTSMWKQNYYCDAHGVPLTRCAAFGQKKRKYSTNCYAITPQVYH